MTLSSEDNKTIAAGNGSATEFTFTFKILDADDIVVIHTDADGNETTLTRGSGSSNYTVDGVGESTGTVTYPNSGSPIASGTTLTMYRDVGLTQATSLTNQGYYFPTAIETALDTIVMMIQKVQSDANRTLTIAVTDEDANLVIPNAAARAGKALGFDSEGDAVALVSVPEGTVSTAMEPVIGAATIAAAKTLLGLGECADEDIGYGLQDSSGDLIVNFPTSAVSSNQSIDATDHLTQFLATGAIEFTLGTGLSSGFMLFVHALTEDVDITPTSPELFYGQSAGTSIAVPAGGAAIIICDGSGTWHKFISSFVETKTASITFIIDGASSPITTGVQGFLSIPFDCTIQSVRALADQSGSIVIDIWNDTLANFPPTDADSITASAPVTISSDTNSEDSTLTGWSTSIYEGDILAFNVDSATTVERVTIALEVTRT